MRNAGSKAAGVLWAVKEKGVRTQSNGPAARPQLPVRQGAHEGEHVFRVMECQFDYRKVRYRGLAKNNAQVFLLLALANLYLARRSIASV